MDNTPQSQIDNVAMPIHGTKRKGVSANFASPKRARRDPSPEESDPDFSVSASSDQSSEAEVNFAASSIPTPLTPLSSKASPRFPSDLKNIHCTYDGCDKAFNRPAKLSQHLRSHTNLRPFLCPHPPCTKNFLRETHLKHHVKSAHSEVRDHVCQWEDCGKSFITSTRLKRHHAAHEGRQKFKCAECGHSFRKHGTLQKHVRMAHEGQKPFICGFQYDEGQECGTGFDTAGKLKSHEGRVHGGKRFWCSICSSEGQNKNSDLDQAKPGTGFSTYAALQEHTGFEHPPTCTDCGLQCSSQAALKGHVEIQHGLLGVDQRKTHICPEPDCGRGFTKKGNLNHHYHLVHGSKRFVCGNISRSGLKNIEDWDGYNACGQFLSSKANLVEHIRTAHLGLESLRKARNKIVAGNSGKGPARKEQASTLMRLTGSGYAEESGRKISCLISECDFRFSRDYDLELHVETHHGLAYSEVQNLMFERDDPTSLPTWEGPPTFATAEDLQAEKALDAQSDDRWQMQVMDDKLEERAAQGGRFWVGGQTPDADDTENDWIRDEMEMQQLVEGDYDMEVNAGGHDGDIDMIDPVLR